MDKKDLIKRFESDEVMVTIVKSFNKIKDKMNDLISEIEDEEE